MATISDQASLRASVVDWLNRSDLSNNQVDQFIEMGESKIYEHLRIPPLEKTVVLTISSDTSRISIPSDFLELIEFRKTFVGSCDVDPGTNVTPDLCEASNGVWTSTSLSDDVILERSDTRTIYASNKQALPYTFARDGSSFVVTDNVGNVAASGAYTMRYYRIVPAIGETYTNGQVFRSNQNTCESLVRQLDDSPGATYTAYVPANGSGNCTINYADVEKIEWLLNGDYEIILYAALAIASEYLGNDEDVARYTRLYMSKIQATNERALRAERSGGNISMSIPNFQGL